MVISIWVTNNCNMRCDYCYEGEKDTFFLSLGDCKYIEEFILLAEEVSKDDGIYMKFFGGEPLLNFRFIKYFIENFKESNVFYSITTVEQWFCPMRIRVIYKILKGCVKSYQ